MLKRLKSLFVIEEEESDASFLSGDKAGEKEGALNEGEVNERFLKVLARAIEDSNQEGFDYFEFREFLRALDSMEMDEQTRFKSAYANAQIMGATVDRLKESAEHYLGVLEREKGKFEIAAENRVTGELERQKSELGQVKQLIADKEAQIEQLKKEIEQLRGQVDVRNEQIAGTEAKVWKTSSDFMQTYRHLVEQIKSDMQKIHTYLAN